MIILFNDDDDDDDDDDDGSFLADEAFGGRLTVNSFTLVGGKFIADVQCLQGRLYRGMYAAFVAGRVLSPDV